MHGLIEKASGKLLLSASLLLIACLLLFAEAALSSITIKGKIKASKGYTLVALAKGGSTVSKKLGTSGEFKLRLKGSKGRGAILHLIRPSGSYFGPVVLKRQGRRAYLELAGAAANLGPLALGTNHAYARRALPKNAVNQRESVSAKKGVPIGAGKLGFVKTRNKKSASIAAKASDDADKDSDGIPSVIDIDDDGDLILDSVDQDSSSDKVAPIGTNIRVTLPQSLNVNAGGVTDSQIDQLVKDRLLLIFSGGNDRSAKASSWNVNCFNLPYCKQGAGTATVDLTSDLRNQPGAPAEGSLWTDYDPDGDGLPNLFQGLDGRFEMNVHPRATTNQIAPGDSFEYMTGTGADASRTIGALAPYFVTSLAVTLYNGGSGAASVTYPVTEGNVGTQSSPIPMSSEKLALTVWKPQRRAVKGAESGDFIDMGKLAYGIEAQVEGGPAVIPTCKREDYSALSPTLTTVANDPGAQLIDTADDARPDAANTLSFTIDLGSCLRRAGLSFAGQRASVEIDARGNRSSDLVSQQIYVTMP